MKILYALQATGNGHISRANEIIEASAVLPFQTITHLKEFAGIA
jgi:hypothetical protein